MISIRRTGEWIGIGQSFPSRGSALANPFQVEVRHWPILSKSKFGIGQSFPSRGSALANPFQVEVRHWSMPCMNGKDWSIPIRIWCFFYLNCVVVERSCRWCCKDNSPNATCQPFSSHNGEMNLPVGTPCLQGLCDEKVGCSTLRLNSNKTLYICRYNCDPLFFVLPSS